LCRYEEALAFHQQAIVLSPLNPATYSAIGRKRRRPPVINLLKQSR
jgi:hypothetical protein